MELENKTKISLKNVEFCWNQNKPKMKPRVE